MPQYPDHNTSAKNAIATENDFAQRAMDYNDMRAKCHCCKSNGSK